jgi:hypothetical protein
MAKYGGKGRSLRRSGVVDRGAGTGAGRPSGGRHAGMANTEFKPVRSKITGRTLGSVIYNARSGVPVSILNGGKQTFGPLGWRGNDVDYQAGVKRPFRGSRGGES